MRTGRFAIGALAAMAVGIAHGEAIERSERKAREREPDPEPEPAPPRELTALDVKRMSAADAKRQRRALRRAAINARPSGARADQRTTEK